MLETVDKSADIWVLDNSYKVECVESKTFTGYKQKANSPKLPQEVKEGEQVVVLYEADKTATKKLNYQVQRNSLVSPKSLISPPWITKSISFR